MKLGKIGSINAPQAEPISIRCYTGNYRAGRYSAHNQNASNGMVLTLATETTSDRQQSLTFGSCGVWVNGSLYKIILFHDENLDSKKVDVIKQVADALQKEKNCIVIVSSKDEFVTKVFYPYVYEARAKCVSFDLPYELSRLATSWGTARKMQDAFSIKLVENNPRLPAIKIKSINSDAAFIQFATPLRTKSEKKKIPTHKVYRGYFLDLKTLGYAMSNESFDRLDEIVNTFGVDTNLQNKKGITKDAIRNNVEKTLTMHNLYCKIISVLEDTFLVKPFHANKLYSPASIGKLYLEKLNIKPLLEKDSDFSKEIMGNLMSAYYGGKVETRIRKTPVPVTYLDCTSTYPTLFSLMNMYSFLIAEKIETSITTEKTQKFLDEITLQDISDKETWKYLTTICKVVPDGNMIVPIRCSYGSKKTTNIGVNYLKSTDGTSLWYTVADLIASKLLTGHTPIIEKAITFAPVGIQQNIPDEKIDIFKGVTVNPRNENFIEKLIEKRLEMKQSLSNCEIDKTVQNTIKIIANTASYGIHIQVNTEKSEKQNESVTVYGIDESFSVDHNTISRKEIPAKHFNPILGVFLPAAARLVLAAAENIVLSHRDGYIAYMDTDSIMVSPKHANEIQKFFQKLNLYENKNVKIMKIEKSDNGKLLENVLFYGISSKRYALFEYDEIEHKFNIHKFTSHGLAHLLDVNTKQWWHDILTMHYSPERKQEILDKYDTKYAVSKMSITTPNVLKRFSRLRPFNKILVGAGCKADENGNVIIPTLPYLDAKNREYIQYIGFTNYTTGEKYSDSDASLYWKPLSQMLEDYADHKETKSGGDVGLLPRLRMKVGRNLIKYVGKEVGNLDATNVLGVVDDSDSCTIYDNLEKKILDVRPRDSHKFGISRSNLISLQKKIRENGVLRLHKKTIEKIISCSIMARGDDVI